MTRQRRIRPLFRVKRRPKKMAKRNRKLIRKLKEGDVKRVLARLTSCACWETWDRMLSITGAPGLKAMRSVLELWGHLVAGTFLGMSTLSQLNVSTNRSRSIVWEAMIGSCAAVHTCVSKSLIKPYLPLESSYRSMSSQWKLGATSLTAIKCKRNSRRL